MNEGGGEFELRYQERLRVNGGLDNHGVLTFREGGVVEGNGPVINKPNGYIEMLGGGSIAAPLTNYGVIDTEDGPGTGPGGQRGMSLYIRSLDENHGEIYVGDWHEESTRLHIDSEFVNYGAVSVDGEGVTLSGGDITNRGIIVGFGTVTNRVDNEGIILTSGSSGGILGMIATGCTNSGRIEVEPDSGIAFLAGLAINDGVIALAQGLFHNLQYDMSNNGLITGYGSFRAGELTNNGRVGVGVGDMSIYGPVVNNGEVSVEDGSTAVFFSDVSGPGDFPGPGTAMFLGGYSPGASPAVISFGGNVTFGPAAGLAIELAENDNSDGDDPRYDALEIAADVALGGTLELAWLLRPRDAACKFGGAYDLIAYDGQRTGEFAGVAGTFSAYVADIDYDAEMGGARAVRVTLYDLLDGDCDLDGAVERYDFLALKASFGSTGADWFAGELTFDGEVNYLDYVAMKRNGGASVPGYAAIPEPASVCLLLPALLLAIRRRGAGLRAGKGPGAREMRAERTFARPDPVWLPH
jgi:hypothetical protein